MFGGGIADVVRPKRPPTTEGGEVATIALIAIFLGILQFYKALRGTESLGVGIYVDSDSPPYNDQKIDFGIIAFLAQKVVGYYFETLATGKISNKIEEDPCQTMFLSSMMTT